MAAAVCVWRHAFGFSKFDSLSIRRWSIDRTIEANPPPSLLSATIIRIDRMYVFSAMSAFKGYYQQCGVVFSAEMYHSWITWNRWWVESVRARDLKMVGKLGGYCNGFGKRTLIHQVQRQPLGNGPRDHQSGEGNELITNKIWWTWSSSSSRQNQ